MRILFTFVGGNGHFEPLVPIAQQAQAAGHTIAFSGRPGMLPNIQAKGFTAFASGPDFGDSDQRFPLLKVDIEREERALRNSFAGKLAQARAADLIALCREWQPDLMVCDEIDFGAMIAAEHLGLPYASVLVIAAGSFVRPDVVADALNEVRAAYQLPPDPGLTMLSRYLVVSPFPPSYRHPDFPLPPTAHAIRPAALKPAGDSRLNKAENTPLVYFTLGTVFNRESGDLFARVLRGLHDLPIQVIVTVGPHIDPQEFGAQPPHVQIEQFIPQAQLLPHCDLMISHGGSGSVIGALAYGVPLVLIPMGADQPLNAERCEALGVGITLDAVETTSEEVASAVKTVLEQPSYREAARRLQAEITALPTAEYAVSLLERLAVEKRAITAE